MTASCSPVVPVMILSTRCASQHGYPMRQSEDSGWRSKGMPFPVLGTELGRRGPKAITTVTKALQTPRGQR